MVGRRQLHPQHGAALLIFLVLLVMGGLTYLVGSFSPESIEARRAQTTHIALVQAREALIGYALKYRDAQAAKDLNSTGDDDRAMYGYLPLPDLGTSRNTNIDPNCHLDPTDPGSPELEGCDANTFTGLTFDANGIGPTVVGRFPWRTLGTGPLRDGHGECLWLIVSSLHSRIQQSPLPLLAITPPMNWDTLGQLDVVVANGTNALVSALASAHERPVAVIFAPGPPLPGQDRSTSSTDDVRQCGGNYSAANYLDPATASALGGVTNYLAGINLASGATGDSDPTNDADTPKSLVTRGKIFATGASFLPGGCQGSNCTLVANDIGLPVTSGLLFGAIRKNVHFRTDINSMLDRMVNCLRDQTIASGTAARISDNVCYDGNQHPLGYYDHYKELVFLAKPAVPFTVNGDNTCAGALIFAEQRSGTQTRVGTERNDFSKYLEAPNFPLTSATSFMGPALFDRSPPQTPWKDIVRCIPSSPTFTPVTSPTLTTLGFGQLVAYDAAMRTLTLGKENVTTDFGAPGTALFGCAWLADSRSLGNGFRTYFSFQFKKVGTSVGSNGFVFAIADAVNNSLASCGAAGSHLGYSGDNGFTPQVKFPKIGIEFDQSKNALFPTTGSEQSSTSAGRNDPCYTCGTGTADTHAAIIYWGHESAELTTDFVILPDFDDNVHSFPTTSALIGNLRPPPTSPAVSSPGLKFVNLRGYPTSAYDSRLFHVRVEVKPSRNVNTSAAELSNTSVQTEVWIESDPNSVNQVAALRNTTRPMSLLYPGYASILSNNAVIFDVPVNGSSCNPVAPCPATQACGTDNICYRPALQTVRLGFTGSQRTTDQEVTINNFFTTWLP